MPFDTKVSVLKKRWRGPGDPLFLVVVLLSLALTYPINFAHSSHLELPFCKKEISKEKKGNVLFKTEKSGTRQDISCRTTINDLSTILPTSDQALGSLQQYIIPDPFAALL